MSNNRTKHLLERIALLALLLPAACSESRSNSNIPRDQVWPRTPSEYSIGVLTGPDPFNLTGSIHRIQNPVLTASDIPGIAAAYVADPFLFQHNNRWYLFYELLRASPRRGCIAWAESDDGLNWKHRGVAIEEPFHLSYPLVFEHNGKIYMIPESNEAGDIRLYEAQSFPGEWKLKTRITEGVFVDATILRHNDLWWLFASDLANLNLYLFYSEQLEYGWTKHPQSPVIRNDIQRARQGGRMLKYDDRLWRFAQNCYPRYGTDTRHYEITKLTTSAYEERDGSDFPLIEAGMFPWATLGMHHVDHHPYRSGDEAWLVAVDGNSPAQPEIELEIAFGDGSFLLGATRRPARIAPGEDMLLRFYWKQLPDTDRPAMFVHFKRGKETVLQADHHLDGRHENYELFVTIPEHIPAGDLEIHVGLHRDGKRLAVESPYRQRHQSVGLPFGVTVLDK